MVETTHATLYEGALKADCGEGLKRLAGSSILNFASAWPLLPWT